ncbi:MULTISPECIES: hypothetical protein [Microcystis]
MDIINQTEYNLVRDLSILGNRVYLEVPALRYLVWFDRGA